MFCWIPVKWRLRLWIEILTKLINESHQTLTFSEREHSKSSTHCEIVFDSVSEYTMSWTHWVQTIYLIWTFIKTRLSRRVFGGVERLKVIQWSFSADFQLFCLCFCFESLGIILAFFRQFQYFSDFFWNLWFCKWIKSSGFLKRRHFCSSQLRNSLNVSNQNKQSSLFNKLNAFSFLVSLQFTPNYSHAVLCQKPSAKCWKLLICWSISAHYYVNYDIEWSLAAISL